MSENTFKASNGLVISEIDEGDYMVTSPSRVEINVDPYQSKALREYFQHERDQQLGRWRWPENPNVVIYRDESKDDSAGRCIIVIREDTAATTYFWEKHCSHPDPIRKAAAKWFFEEGPGKEPERPWEDAQPGEVWRLTVDDEEMTLMRGRNAFVGDRYYLNTEYDCITAGRKLVNADGSVVDE